MKPAGSKTAYATALLAVVCAQAAGPLPRFTVPLRLRNGRLAADCARAIPHRTKYCRAIDEVLRKTPVDSAAPQLDFSSVVVPALQSRLPQTSPLTGPLDEADGVPLEWSAPLTFEVHSTNPAIPPPVPGITAVYLDSPANLPSSAWYALPTWACREVLRANAGEVQLTRPVVPVPDLSGIPSATLLDAGSGNSDLALRLTVEPEPVRRFLGLTAEYRARQGLRLTGLTEFRNGTSALTAEAGTFGSGLGKLSWTRDLIAMRRLGVRLALTVDGGSTTTARRLLRGVRTDERRTGFGARFEIEPARDEAGHTLTFWLAPRRETVSHTATTASIMRLDAGLDYAWAHHLSIRPAVRLTRSWAVIRLDGTYRRPVGQTEYSLLVHTAWAATATPLFEQPSVGGADSLRGFREDTLQTRRLVAAQQELWIPAWRKIGFVLFLDVAAADGLRRGIGAGPRLRIRSASLGLDYGFGFEPGTPASLTAARSYPVPPSRGGQLCLTFRIL
jgi:hypothetical protein